MKRNQASSIADVEGLLVPRIKFPSCRQQLLMMAFFVFFVTYCIRIDVSVVMIALVNHTELDRQNLVNHKATNDTMCPEYVKNKKVVIQEGPYAWDSETTGLILCSFYYGYIGTNLLAGMLVKRSSGKWFIFYGLLCECCIHILIPTVVRFKGGSIGFICMRILEGVACGFIFPGMQDMAGRWIPRLERGFMVPTIYAGAQLGSVFSVGFTGAMAENISWSSPFYGWGCLGIICCILWFFKAHNSPSDHPNISPEEREYIRLAISATEEKKFPFPWKSVFKSAPFWALLLAHFSYNWGFYTLVSAIPLYFRSVLYYNTTTLSWLLSMAYLVNSVSMVSSGLVSDILIKKHYLPTTVVRRLLIGVGNSVCAILIVLLYYIGCNRHFAVFLVIVGIGVNGMSFSGWIVNHLDLAPNFSGMLMGITNTFAQVPGLVSMSILASLLRDYSQSVAWLAIFWISFGVYVIGTVSFCCVGSGRRQRWSYPPADVKPLPKDNSEVSVHSSISETALNKDKKSKPKKVNENESASKVSESAASVSSHNSKTSNISQQDTNWRF